MCEQQPFQFCWCNLPHCHHKNDYIALLSGAHWKDKFGCH
jgi:hypothetical protein